MADEPRSGRTAESSNSEHDNPKMGQFQAMHDRGMLDLSPFSIDADDVWHRSNPPRPFGSGNQARKGARPKSPLKVAQSAEDMGRSHVAESKPRSIWDDEFEEDLEVYNKVGSPIRSTAGEIDHVQTPVDISVEGTIAGMGQRDADQEGSQDDSMSDTDPAAGGTDPFETTHVDDAAITANKPATIFDYIDFLEHRLRDEQVLTDQLRIALQHDPQHFHDWKSQTFLQLQNDRWQLKTGYLNDIKALKARIGYYRDADTLAKDELAGNAQAAEVDAATVDTSLSPNTVKALAFIERIKSILGKYRPAPPRSHFTRHRDAYEQAQKEKKRERLARE